MSLLGGIAPKTLFSTPEEWHSFLIGFFEVLCPWPARIWASGGLLDNFMKEYHYYMAGRGLGLVVLVFVLIGIAKFIMEVLL